MIILKKAIPTGIAFFVIKLAMLWRSGTIFIDSF